MDSEQSGKSNETFLQREFWNDIGPACDDGEMCGTVSQIPVTSGGATSSVEATPAQSTGTHDVDSRLDTPICPDTSLPWSDDFAHDGWSARMFLHQQLHISRPHWTPSDTERWLSASTLLHLRVKPGFEISLSDVITPVGVCSGKHFRSAKMIRGLVRRAWRWRRRLRVLLRTERGIIPTTITFGSPNAACVSLTLKSAKPLPDSLQDGLLAFLRQHAPECSATP